jgi:CheY-like chemotaxis protein
MSENKRLVFAAHYPDDRSDLEFVAEFFRGKGYTALVVDSGRSAMELIQEEAPDVLVCPTMMPQYDGIQLASALKKARGPASGVILLTSLHAEVGGAVGLADRCHPLVDAVIIRPYPRESVAATGGLRFYYEQLLVTISLVMRRLNVPAEGSGDPHGGGCNAG